MKKKIVAKLPGFNCGVCGMESCEVFAELLLTGKKAVSDCRLMLNEQNSILRKSLEAILNKQGPVQFDEKKEITGLIDAYKADIILEPIIGEHSCRETLMPTSTIKLNIGDIVRYRPLGCPIIHFARVVEVNNLLITVHIIGPVHRNGEHVDYKELGICLVVAFEGRYSGARLKVGETVRFLPKHCMMQKVHSGVVVELTRNSVILEGIDLKVWALPEQCYSI